MSSPEDGAVSTEAAARRELEDLGVDPAVSALGAAALALARDIDCAEAEASERASSARALLAVLTQVRLLAPPQDLGDAVSRVGERRDRRRARLSRVK